MKIEFTDSRLVQVFAHGVCFIFKKGNYKGFTLKMDEIVSEVHPVPGAYEEFNHVVKKCSYFTKPKGCCTMYNLGMNEETKSLLREYLQYIEIDPFKQRAIESSHLLSATAAAPLMMFSSAIAAAYDSVLHDTMLHKLYHITKDFYFVNKFQDREPMEDTKKWRISEKCAINNIVQNLNQRTSSALTRRFIQYDELAVADQSKSYEQLEHLLSGALAGFTA